MHTIAWVKLLRHIPEGEQSKLMLVTISGTEIAIQCFLRIDPECLAIKGRLAGSQDAGRVYFIPYAHIDYFGFNYSIKESEFHEIFGNLDLSSLPESSAQEPFVEPEPPLAAESQVASAPRNPSSIKSSVLEKFRSRSVSNPGTAIRPALDE